MKGSDTVEEAIADALKDFGGDASFVVIPHTAKIAPSVEGIA